MDDFEFNNQMEEQKQLSRIKWLHVVLVLSIIGSGLNLFSSLMMALFAPTLMQTFESMSPDLPQEMSIMYETVFNTPRIMYVCLSVLYAMSLAGVLLMWRPARTASISTRLLSYLSSSSLSFSWAAPSSPWATSC